MFASIDRVGRRVINEASLTRAVDTLFVTQSAISKRIQRLEELPGVELFDRNTKPPRPTALANRVYEQAVPLLRAFEHLLDLAREDATPSGTLRLGLPHVVADVVLFDAVMVMKEQFPALVVRSHAQWSLELQRMVESGSLDVAVLMLPPRASLPDELIARQVATFEVKVMQSAVRPLVKRKATIRSLAGHDWILSPDGCGYRAALVRAIGDAGGRLRVSADTYATNTKLRLVAAGLGLGLVPLDMPHTSAWRDKLSVVDVSDFALSLDLWLVFPQYLGNLTRAAEALAQSISAFFRPVSTAISGATVVTKCERAQQQAEKPASS
ncbi:LysR family transcriptional regulator [Trinickia mobilis]|uniref:LysR family transcriptional regulator n=1 Tax=Trinickia mobilis TaxID=2816356 RepID=UPI001A8D71E7|nr:LysR family transcriptional regulator [Trinickia mobilis]